MEALTAIIFASGVALAFLFLPMEQAQTALVGDISRVRLAEAAASILVSLFLLLAVRKIYLSIILINISEELARSAKINIKKYNLLYLASIAIIVALGVKMVGGLLTAALVAIPASSARNWGRNLDQYAYGAMAIGAISAALGIILFQVSGFPAGPLIILSSAVIFLISTAFRR
jgi:ABC-type Mn2+/Zn2+ transport system permease subunit